MFCCVWGFGVFEGFLVLGCLGVTFKGLRGKSLGLRVKVKCLRVRDWVKGLGLRLRDWG